MKTKILADIAPSVHPAKDILPLQGLIKLTFGLSPTAFRMLAVIVCRGKAGQKRLR
jgi:hypothetical protein